jgi:hypothetical protein
MDQIVLAVTPAVVRESVLVRVRDLLPEDQLSPAREITGCSSTHTGWKQSGPRAARSGGMGVP